MHDCLFANQRAMSREAILAHAGALGLDMTRFMADLDGTRQQATLDRDLAEGKKLGVEGTPTFFINGMALVGAQPVDAFVRVIDKALAAPASRRRAALTGRVGSWIGSRSRSGSSGGSITI